tara:strand:+ start:1131 stop:2018 length:888 start_codon:yes stop_codon:yes gene_type:complete
MARKAKKRGIEALKNLIKKFKPKPKPKPRGRPPKKTSNIPRELSVPVTYGKDITAGALKVLGQGSLKKGLLRAGISLPLYGTGLYYGGKALFGDDEETKAESTVTPEESTEVETSDRLGDILRQKTMTIAADNGRATPVFFDYVKAFPSSYMEKVGKDPEFAKQMMAGFLAMMKPVAGPVPVNPFVAFGEAALEEGVRQEEAITDQEKLLSMSDEDIAKLQRIKTKSTGITTDDLTVAGAILQSIKKEYGLKKDALLVDRENPTVDLTAFGLLGIMRETNNDPTEIGRRVVPKAN